MIGFVVVLLFVANLVQMIFLYRMGRRLLQFDDLFELFVHDIQVNIRYFEKLLSTPLASNVPEIVEANKNMNVMNERLREFIRQMEEQSGRQLFQRPSASQPRPKVVD